MNPKATTPLDVELGRRLREARTKAGVTQMALAETLGITFQQIQKYEWGINRLSVGRLLSIASALDTSAESLLVGLSAMARTAPNGRARGSSARKK
jgi:transcriptional regulator with XRE-family HTH domain